MAERDPATKQNTTPRRRIVIGLDTSFMAREALALAARVAASVDASLSGVFVEDENLLALSALPFVREISMSGAVSPLDETEMLRAMQAQAQIARRILERVAKDAHVAYTFDVARGHRLASLAHHANEADTLVIRAHEASHHDVNRTVRAATQDARADVLLAARGVAVGSAFVTVPAAQPANPHGVVMPPRPLLAIDEGSSQGEACVSFSQSLALRIAMPFRRLFARGFSAADLASAARKSHAGLIVVSANALADDAAAAKLSAAAGCPVLLLGGERYSTTPRAPG